MNPIRTTCLLLALCIGGYAFAAAPWPSRGVYAGYYSRGFEVSRFQPQGSDEQWWLQVAPSSNFESVAQAAMNGRVYVVVRGSISAPGNHGHLGRYSRELTVTAVVESRPLTAEEAHGF